MTIPPPAGAQANATNAPFRIGGRGFARAVPKAVTTANTVKCAGFPPGIFPRGQDHPTSHTAMALYKSEITQFLEELKTQKPDLEAQQRQGRSLLWDKDPIDLE
ncbi:DUF3460 family protein, partial [Escherichia coli]|nr:DUF3460 family protein [Escherichia coli]